MGEVRDGEPPLGLNIPWLLCAELLEFHHDLAWNLLVDCDLLISSSYDNISKTTLFR